MSVVTSDPCCAQRFRYTSCSLGLCGVQCVLVFLLLCGVWTLDLASLLWLMVPAVLVMWLVVLVSSQASLPPFVNPPASVPELV